jgi:hypothetical protein
VDRSIADQRISYVIKSYRYLRLAIVGTLLGLTISLLLERGRTGCWQTSVSAYYYTPVHSMFIGTLVALAVCFIAIRGATEWEDVLLNVAGVMAAIVAFVPTEPSPNVCQQVTLFEPPGMTSVTAQPPGTTVNLGERLDFVSNNLRALMFAGSIAFVAAVVGYLIANKLGHVTIRWPKSGTELWDDWLSGTGRGSTAIGIVLGGLILLVAMVWYLGYTQNFLDHAHQWAAIGIFVLVWFVVILNNRGTPSPVFRTAYRVLAWLMPLAFVVIKIIRVIDGDWRHDLLVLELLEVAALIAFWTAATVEHWKSGVPAGTARTARQRRSLSRRRSVAGRPR